MKHTTAVSILLSLASVASAAAIPAQNNDPCDVFGDNFSPLECGGVDTKSTDVCNVFGGNFDALKCGGIDTSKLPKAPDGGSVSTSCNNHVCSSEVCDANGKCKTVKQNLKKRQGGGASTDPSSPDFDPFSFLPAGIPGINAPLPAGTESSSSGSSFTCTNGKCVSVTCQNGQCTQKNTGQSKRDVSKRESGGGSTDPFSPDFDPLAFLPKNIPGVTAPLPKGSEGATAISCSNGRCVTLKCDAQNKCTQSVSNQKL